MITIRKLQDSKTVHKASIAGFCAVTVFLLLLLIGDQGHAQRTVRCGCYCGITLPPPCSEDACKRACGWRDGGGGDRGGGGQQIITPRFNPKAEAVRHYQQALELITQNRWEEASSELERAIKYNPGLVEAQFLYAQALDRRGHMDAAIRRYQLVLNLDPNHAQARHRLNELANYNEYVASYRQGISLFSQGKWEEAEAAFRRALAFDPNDWAAHHNLGSMLEKQGKDEAAADAYRKAIQLAPKHLAPYSELARLEAKIAQQKIKQFVIKQEVIKQKVVKQDVKELVAQGELSQAEVVAREAVALNPKDARARADLGRVLELRGDAEGAKAEYRRALQLDPNNVEARERLDALAKAEAAQAKATKRVGAIIQELQERTVLVPVHGQPMEFTVMEKPMVTNPTAGSQLQSAAKTGQLAAGVSDPEKASTRAQLTFDTAGLKAEPLEKLAVSGKGPGSSEPIVPETMRTPEIVELIQKRDAAKKEIAVYQKELDELKAKGDKSQETRVRIAQIEDKKSKAEQKKIFYDFSIGDKIEQMKKEMESSDSSESADEKTPKQGK